MKSKDPINSAPEIPRENKFLAGIESTGFGLEFLISSCLVDNKWTVINNKYYIDDVQGSAREIDILAYKTKIKNGIQIYTTLIISCKKNTENSWALLAKEKDINNPNIDWNPITLWSNEPILKLIIEHYEWKKKYLKSSSDLCENIFSPKKHIFAFQELSNKTGKPKNDKAIFDSIVSCMKSQEYEINGLAKRKKEKSLYNFNLISVIDAPLLRINYKDNSTTLEEINSDIYVGSYIINKKETHSRVHFINSNNFNSSLSHYDKLHKHNLEQSVILTESFYDNCLHERKKINLFLKDFNRTLHWDIYEVLKEIRPDREIGFKDTDINWSQEKECVQISIDSVYENSEVESLNTNLKIQASVSSALKKYYHYEGPFFFDNDIPF
tara:strand:- start:82578 stop:83726 length:1149 start_codon:yes stop_codon:yes gene_type:complete